MVTWLYLASQSPRRHELLAQIGVRVELLLPAAGEDTESIEAVRANEPADQYVKRVVLAKLSAARLRLRQRGLPAGPILCADTTVALGSRLMGKPADRDAAIVMLESLSGRSHRVLTAVAVSCGDQGQKQKLKIKVSRVRFGRLTRADIETYVDTGEPYDKAGGYGIQGAASAFVRDIEGSYSGIMGLPLYETAQLLRHLDSPRDP